MPSAASKKAQTSSMQVVHVRKPGPGLVVLNFPFDLTTRADGIHVATYLVQSVHRPEPEADHAITERLIKALTKGTHMGVIIEKHALTTYRSIGKMPQPHRTPRIVPDRYILQATHKIAVSVAGTQLRFVHNTTRRELRHDGKAPLSIPETY